jgi:subtilisin
MSRRRRGLACALAVVGLAALAGPIVAGDAATTTAPYVVVLRDAVTDPLTTDQTLETRLGISPKFEYSRAVKGLAADLSATQVSQLQADSSVAYVAADTTFQAAGMATLAAGETAPPGVRRIGAASTTQAHQAANAAVAVLDTGIDLPNADLNAASGTNCVKTGTAAQDDNGHGTHVAGTLAARNTGSTVVGVAPGTKLYAVKVLGAAGSGTLSQILCGIDWVRANAATLNIKVANMSLVGGGSDDGNCGNTNADAEHKAICNATAAGVTFVVSAGNGTGDLGKTIPAAYNEVLTVTAMSDTDGKSGGLGAAPSCKTGEKDDSYATYSNFAVSAAAQAHTIAAPGTCVVSDKPGGGTATYYGTSQASPHAAGTVALCLGNGGLAGPCAGLTPAQVIQKVRSDAAAGATTSTGFAGDPLRPVTGRYYGYVARAGSY